MKTSHFEGSIAYWAARAALDAMNELNVNLQHSILTLAGNGWSNRRIARELGLHRETVGQVFAAGAIKTGHFDLRLQNRIKFKTGHSDPRL